MNKEVFVGYDVYVGDMSTLNTCDEFTPPDIIRIKLDSRSAAGDFKITTPLLESLKTEWKFKSMPTALYEEIAKLDEAVITSKKAVQNGSEIQNHHHECTGGIDMSYGSIKNGEYLDVVLTQDGLNKYLYKVDGKVQVDINHEANISKIGGVDQMEKIRAILKG